MDKEYNKRPAIIAIITARGGSKGVPRKNIRPLGGKPLIGYMIEAASQSAWITKLVVSSDDDEILEVSRQLGGDRVHALKRPPELAQDKSPSLPVIEHAVETLEALEGIRFDHVVMLQPTTPFTTTEDIDGALQKLVETGADSVMSVYEVNEHHPAKAKRITEDDRLMQYVENYHETENTRQKLMPVYKRNGAVYASKRDIVMVHKKLYGADDIVTRPYVVPGERSVDINTMLDFYLAEALIEFWKKEKGGNEGL